MKLTELFTATGEPFSYYPGLVHQFDISVNATVFLCFIAWRTFPDEVDGWKALSIDIVKEATGLSVKEQSTSRKQLVKAGLILERYARLEHKLKFKLLPAEIAVSPNAESADAQAPIGNVPTSQNGVSTKELKGDKKGSKKENPADAGGVARNGEGKSLKRELTDSWCAAFNASHSFRYVFRHAIDGKAADRFLAAGITAAEVVSVAKRAWKNPKGFQCKMAATLAGLESKWNDIQQELSASNSAPKFNRQAFRNEWGTQP